MEVPRGSLSAEKLILPQEVREGDFAITDLLG